MGASGRGAPKVRRTPRPVSKKETRRLLIPYQGEGCAGRNPSEAERARFALCPEGIGRAKAEGERLSSLGKSGFRPHTPPASLNARF